MKQIREKMGEMDVFNTEKLSKPPESNQNTERNIADYQK